jgi:AcrR family transcriptional regulator
MCRFGLVTAKAVAVRPARDRNRTEEALLNAARALIAEEGFQALGVNKLAARAGVDKQLIYRYFGGLDGVVARVAQDVGFWFGAAPEIDPNGDYATVAKALLGAYLRALRDSKMLRQAVLWELADDSPAARQVEALRSAAFQSWVKKALGNRTAPAGRDAPALNALLIGAIQYLAVRGDRRGVFAGMSLAADTDWQRLETALFAMIDAVYADPNARR